MSDYFESGFTVREPAWHGKGYVADRYPNDWEEAREWAGLTWEPEARPLYTMVEPERDTGDLPIPPVYAELPAFRQIVRNDTGATLGVVSNYYEVITHEQMGEVVEAILAMPNVKYETAGAIQEGRGVWALAYLDEPITLPGDTSVTLPYLALLTRHDGTGALKALSTSVRIVCANTWSAAETESGRNGTAFTFSHSKQWRDRLEEAKETITGVRRDFAAYREFAEQMLKVRVTHEQTEDFIKAFIPSPPEGLISQRVQNNVEEARTTMRVILAGPTSEGIAGSAFGLVQAAGEYLDHYRSFRTQDSYYARQLLRPEPLKAKAAQIVRELVGV